MSDPPPSPLSSLFCTLQAGEILFQDTHKGAGTVFIRITLVKYFLPNGHLGPRGSFLGNPDLSIHEIQNRSVRARPPEHKRGDGACLSISLRYLWIRLESLARLALDLGLSKKDTASI